MGKVIKAPGSNAAEYGEYAFYAYYGCTHNCEYCYLKQGRFKKVLGIDKPTLKREFRTESDVVRYLQRDIEDMWEVLQKCGVFFVFNTDPFLKETYRLTLTAMDMLLNYQIPITLLTKSAEFVNPLNPMFYVDMCDVMSKYKGSSRRVAFGFTLTGHDELEPNASSNEDRIRAMRMLHDSGNIVWASIEPIIDLSSSFDMIYKSRHICQHYKIGLLKGGKYNAAELKSFITEITKMLSEAGSTVYFKDSMIKKAGYFSRADLGISLDRKCLVYSDYDIFKNLR